MQLNKLTIRNFGSFGNKSQTILLRHMGLTLLVGRNLDSTSFKSNGAGKSSLLEALVYALYGEKSDGERGNSIINRQVGKNMYVGLSFTKDGHEYMIKRYRKDSKYKNKTLLFIDKHNITQRSIKTTNKKIVDIIGIDKTTYLHSYLFGGTDVVDFTDATDKQKKQILENVANLGIYPKAQKIAKNKLKRLTNKQVSIKANVEAQQESVKTLMKVQEQSGENNRNRANDIQDTEHKIINYTKKSKQLRFELPKNIGHVKDEIAKFKPVLADRDKKQNMFTKCQQAFFAKKGTQRQLKNKLDEIKNNLVTYRDQIVALRSNKQKKCFYCGQVLNKAHKAYEIKKLASQLMDSASQYKKDLVKYKHCNVDKELSNVKNAKASLNKINQVSKKSNQLLATWNSYQAMKEKIVSLVSLIKTLASHLTHLRNASKSKSYLSDIKNMRSKLGKSTQQLKDSKSKSDLIAKTVDVYSNQGVKSQVLDLVLPYINKRANHYLKVLTSGSINILISPTTTAKNGNTSDKINVEVNNLHGADDYNGLSSGEKRRVDLGIILALQDYVLSQANTTMNFCALDELFSHLDRLAYQPVMRILRERLKRIPDIIVVTHQPGLQQYFANKIVVTKKHGFSTVSQS